MTLGKGGISERLQTVDKLQFNSYIEFYRSNMTLHRKFPQIVFNYVQNSNVNAFARSKDPQFAIIGIYEGGYHILRDLFCRMLSYNSLFATIGDQAKEIYDSPSLRNFYTNIEDLVSYGNLDFPDTYEFLMPKDKIRQTYSNLLFQIAREFVFEHELSHILNGHTLFGNDAYGQDFLSVIPDGKDRIPKITRLTLEMDADCTGFNRCLNRAIYMFDNPRSFSEDYRQFFLTIEDAISNVTAAVYAYFKLFGDGQYQAARALEIEHSPPKVRQLILLSTAEEFIKKNYSHLNLDLSNIRRNNLAKVEEVEKAYKVITGNLVNREAYAKENYTHHPHRDMLLAHWAEIRPEIMKYSYRE